MLLAYAADNIAACLLLLQIKYTKFIIWCLHLSSETWKAHIDFIRKASCMVLALFDVRKGTDGILKHN